MSPARETTPEHWQRFWTDGRPLHEVYSNQGRLVDQALAEGSLSGRRILEVGAGTGRDTMELVRRGASGYVLDYTFGSLHLMQEHARHLGVPLHLVCADARKLPFRDGSFGLVFHQGLLEHFRDPPLDPGRERARARTGHRHADRRRAAALAHLHGRPRRC